MGKKKKDERPYRIHSDCKACMKERTMNMSLLKNMEEAEGVTLVTLRGSLPYLEQMTNVMECWSVEMAEKFGDKNYSEMMSDYFVDVRNLIKMFAKMKELGS